MLKLSVSGVNGLCTAGRAECDSEGPESRNNNNHKKKPPTELTLTNQSPKTLNYLKKK